MAEESYKPLAERLRPEHPDEYIGQAHLMGPEARFRQLLEHQKVSSMIFWGPPGVGKTSLARLIGKMLDRPFFTLSAISSGVKEVRQVIQSARMQPGSILFIDEIHRFNKAQQDALLGAVEEGIIILIGATTENPSFEVISALLSRCQVYTLQPLAKEDLDALVEQALVRDEILKQREVIVEENEALYRFSGGDARKLYNLLEMLVNAFPEDPVKITNDLVQRLIQQKMVLYDKNGEQHYDIISAYIKSIRGSDPNAAVYWLARMIEGGEDPKFIARRLLILASEDIGNANPTALVMATNCFQAVNMIGYPEARIILSQATVYLASSPKSNASYLAIKKAQQAVRQMGDLAVPLSIRNAPTQLMKKSGYGQEYKYAHDHPGSFAFMEFLPDALSGTTFYEPGKNAREEEMRKFLKVRWKDKYGY